MLLSRLLLPGFSFIAISIVFSAEPVPAPPAKPPAAQTEQILPREDSAFRPASRPSLLPDEIPSPATPPAASGAKRETVPTPLASTASELDLRIRYRKARNIAEANDKVRAAWDESRAARTDHGKRQALKRYQSFLFAKMLSFDRGIAPLVEQRRKAENFLLEQTHIAPTVPFE